MSSGTIGDHPTSPRPMPKRFFSISLPLELLVDPRDVVRIGVIPEQPVGALLEPDVFHRVLHGLTLRELRPYFFDQLTKIASLGGQSGRQIIGRSSMAGDNALDAPARKLVDGAQPALGAAVHHWEPLAK